MKKVGLYCLICMVIVCFSLFNKENITIERKNYKAANTDFVSTRELAMLAALAYEDVPDDNNYTPISKSANYGCTISSDGSVSGKDSHNCFFRALDNATNSDLKRDGYSVFQYVEGLSSRKMALRPLSTLTADFREEGEDYYFLKFAKTIELENDWNIVHYATDKQLNKLPNDATFYAITYQKGNNYVIAYRGSDYPDLFEWSDNLAYAVSKDHKQALNAYTYAQNEYSRILSQNGNAKIYIVGHSIGGYLAQIGGAAIINTASNRSNANAESPKDLKDLSNYEAIYNPASNLVQVAYFNGMGFGGLNEDSDFTQNIDNALVYLGTHNRDGSRASSGRTVNYSNSVSSSGRLVLYSIDSDPASDIGLHYGEIYKLDVAADAISNHSGKHTVLFGTALKKLIETGNVADTYKEVTSMASISNSSTTLTPTTKYIPPFVLENLTGNSDTSINYNLAPVLENLDKNLKSFDKNYSKYGAMIDNVSDHFNSNHETDSFSCIIDKNNGKLYSNNVTLTVKSNNIDCNNDKCVTKVAYKMPHTYVLNNSSLVDKEYSLGNIINDVALYDYNSSRFISLTAETNNACVKKYTWQYSTDGSNYTDIGTTVNKQIIIPKTVINVSSNSSKTLYFRVNLEYGDKYYSAKADLSGNSIKYIKSDNYTQYNPTNDEDRTLGNSNGVISATAGPITYIYDDKAPDCRFEPSSISLDKGSSAHIRFICSDISSVNFNAGSFKPTSLLSFLKGLSYSANCYNDRKFCDVTINSKKTILISTKEKLIYKSKIKDALGNETSSNVSASLSITVKKKAAANSVAGVVLDNNSLFLNVKDSATLTTTIYPTNASNKDVSWTSSNPNVATVSNGKVTGKGVGTATITVKTADGGKTDTATVKVKKKIKLNLDKKDIYLVVGNSEKLNLSTNSADYNEGFIWSSNNSSIAVVDDNGEVLAKGAGTATITVQTKYGDKAVAYVHVPIYFGTGKYEYTATPTDTNKHVYKAEFQGANSYRAYQSWAYDDNYIYVSQRDAYITRIPANDLKSNGTFKQVKSPCLYYYRSGHLSNIDIETASDGKYLWVIYDDCDDESMEKYISSFKKCNVNNYKVTRIKITNNLFDGKGPYYVNPKGTNTKCKEIKLTDSNIKYYNYHGNVAVDSTNKKVIIRTGDRAKSIYSIYGLDEFKAQNSSQTIEPLYEFDVPNHDPDSTELKYKTGWQGMDIDGDFIYVLEGYDTKEINKINAKNYGIFISVYTLDGKTMIYRYNIKYPEKALANPISRFWEPEGIKIINNEVYIGITSKDVDSNGDFINPMEYIYKIK